jgi:hypothetical protein
MQTVLLALRYSEPPLSIGTPGLLHGNLYLWRVRVVIYERPTTDHICCIHLVIKASTPRWMFEGGMRDAAWDTLAILQMNWMNGWRIHSNGTSQAEPKKERKPWCCLLEIMTAVDGHKMHIFTANIPTFHARHRRYVFITNEFHEFYWSTISGTSDDGKTSYRPKSMHLFIMSKIRYSHI